MPFFQIMWPNLKNTRNIFLMMSHFGTLLRFSFLEKNDLCSELLTNKLTKL